MENLPTADSVADFFLLQIDHSSGDTISNIKLQKLCYYAQAWSLALRDRPLFGDDIEAWAHGPAIPRLYRRFKKYGWQSIDPFDIVSDPLTILDESDQALLASVWKRYGGFTGRQLETMTHGEPPWIAARGDAAPVERCSEVISRKMMRAYFKSKLEPRSGHFRARSRPGRI